MSKIPFAGIELKSLRVRGYMVPLSYRGDLTVGIFYRNNNNDLYIFYHHITVVMIPFNVPGKFYSIMSNISTIYPFALTLYVTKPSNTCFHK